MFPSLRISGQLPAPIANSGGWLVDWSLTALSTQ